MIKLGRALAAGAVASLAAVALAITGWWLMRFEPAVGEAMRRDMLAMLPLPAWIAAGVAAVIGGTVLAALYALAFELVTRRSGWLIGAALGAAHAAAVWLGIGLLAWWLPALAQRVGVELSLLFNSLAAVLAFVAVQVVYGAVVGWLYGTPRHRADAKSLVTWRELFPMEKGAE